MLPQTYTFSTRRWAFVLVCTLVLVLGGYFFLDLPLTQTLHAQSEPWVRELFDVIDELGTSEYYLLPALLAYIYGLYRLNAAEGPSRLRTERIVRGSLFLISTMALGGIIVALLKAGVARARPELLIDHGIYGLGLSFMRVEDYDSFPSSHTMAAFAATAALAILLPRLRWPLMIVATGVAVARVVNLNHYFSDVLASAVIALTVAAYLATRILDARFAWPLRAPWRWFRRPEK